MTLDEFVAVNKGKQIDADGVYEYQCVDLIKQYNKDVIGAPIWTGDPKDYVTNPRPAFYTYEKNTPWYVPPRGSIAIWNGNEGGGHGHTGIVLTSSVLRFSSLDQNWPKGSPVSVVQHNYSNVAGFLVPRKIDAFTAYNQLLSEIQALVSKYPKINN